jgi:hypothetical protein
MIHAMGVNRFRTYTYNSIEERIFMKEGWKRTEAEGGSE